MQYRLKKIKSDASFRQFFRLMKGDKSSIIVSAKKERFKNLELYASVNTFLRSKGLLAPKLLSQQFSNGLMEIEDLGEVSLLKKISISKNKLYFYKRCVDLIIKLQKIKLVKKIKIKKKKYSKINNYNLKTLHKESDLFFDWYLASLTNKDKAFKYKIEIKKELSKIYKKLKFKNKFFVHRDFHISNIMFFKNRLAIIDNQDLIIGNPVYDLVSLLDDVRYKVPIKIKKKLFNYFFENCSLKDISITDLKNDFDILSVQRNLKILGIFVRLYKRDNKDNYLKYLPYTWKLIELRMQNKIFNKLKTMLDGIIKKKLRKKKIFNEN